MHNSQPVEQMSVYARLQRIRAWLWPPTCPLCGGGREPDLDFCDGCERSLPVLSACCSRCALPFASADLADALCGPCQQSAPAYSTVRAPFRYAAPVDRLILGAKYARRLDWVALLGHRLARHVQACSFSVDALVPIPLHRTRLRSRGYNQSLELARPLAARLGLPLLSVLKRTRATAAQTALSRDERRKNMRGAFVAIRPVAGLRIAVVDDVMTSGATAEEAARCLHEAGAGSVEIWVIARA